MSKCVYLVLLAGLATFAGPITAQQQAGRGKCFATFAERQSTGKLIAGAFAVVNEWSATCTGLFTASAGPGRLALQRWVASEWVDQTRGTALHVPQLGPGRYRLVIENVSPIRIDYRVRFRVSGG